MNKPKNEIDTEQIEKIVETAIFINFPATTLKYGSEEMNDSFKTLFTVALMDQIGNMLGYNPKSKFEEVYTKIFKLADDDATESLVKDKIAIDKTFSMSKKITDKFINLYSSFLEKPKVEETTEEDKEIRCQACNRLLTDKVVVYRKHGYEDYYCTIDCLKSKVFQESVNDQ